jgi:hypothetical protein
VGNIKFTDANPGKLYIQGNAKRDAMSEEKTEQTKAEAQVSVKEWKVGEMGFSNRLSTPDEGINYVPHKTSGLQSAADMWIDRDRMLEGLHTKKSVDELLQRTKFFE